MPPDRIDGLVEHQHDQDERIAKQGREISALQTEVQNLRTSIDRNTDALERHARVLNEYSGARKALHYLWVVGSGVAGAAAAWFFGQESKP